MRSDIALLDKLLRLDSSKRENRSLELLRTPMGNTMYQWEVFLPPAFNSALDILRTERVVVTDGVKSTERIWTQGSSFAFSAGDILYDNSFAYDQWGQALKSLRFCLEIVRAASAVPVQNNKPRYPGSVVVRVRKPNTSRTALQTIGETELTQDDLVRFIMMGETVKTSNLVLLTNSLSDC